MGQLAEWKSHKVVLAGRMLQQPEDDPSLSAVTLTIEDANGAPCKVGVPRNFFSRGAPSLGDYIVVYDDDYKSWSPAKAFEGGYTRVLKREAGWLPDAELRQELEDVRRLMAKTLTISIPDLASAIEAEMAEWFHDGISPTLGKYAVDHIIGGIIKRVKSGRALDGIASR